VVSDCGHHVAIWAFAGGAAAASIAHGLTALGLPVVGFDDLAITLRTTDLQDVEKAFRKIDPLFARPNLPEDLGTALKFGLCLPTNVITTVLTARTADAAAVAATCRRRLRLISAAHIR
jgi:hypothetical protein